LGEVGWEPQLFHWFLASRTAYYATSHTCNKIPGSVCVSACSVATCCQRRDWSITS